MIPKVVTSWLVADREYLALIEVSRRERREIAAHGFRAGDRSGAPLLPKSGLLHRLMNDGIVVAADRDSPQ